MIEPEWDEILLGLECGAVVELLKREIGNGPE